MATLDQALQQMRDAGMPDMPPGHPRLDGKIYRFGPKKKAWYKLHEFNLRSGAVAISGSFGMWQGDDSNTTRIEMDWQGVSPEEKASAEAQRTALERAAAEKAERKAAAAATRATFQWNTAQREGGSPYIDRKQITAPGMRYDSAGNVLVPAVVFRDGRPNLVGLQKIAPDGTKRFNTGMSKAGACCPIGKIADDDKLLFIDEGYATARTISMATDGALGGYVAWDAGNLLAVAQMARARHPHAHILFCADDDFLLVQRLQAWLAEDFKLEAAIEIDGVERTLTAADGTEVIVNASWMQDACSISYIHAEVASGRRTPPPRRFENTGLAAATAAARAVGNASVVRPRFSARGENKWTDFNDLHCEESLDACREQLAVAIMESLQAQQDDDGSVTADGADPMYDAAVDVVRKNARASISLIQRILRIGYNRAARLIEAMEAAGVVSAMASNGAREILEAPSNVVDITSKKPKKEKKAKAAGPASAARSAGEPPEWQGGGDGAPADHPGLDWARSLSRDKYDNVLPSLANVYLIFENHHEWQGVMAFDEFSGQVAKLKPPPFAGGEVGEWSDMDDLRSTLWMQQRYGFQPRKEVVMDAALLVADIHKYHVVRAYLDPLEWDGQPRLDHWLTNWLGADDNLYVHTVARKWLLAAVARIYKPGCKADNVLILEGEQGLYKSTALKVLGGDFFTDAPFKLGDKDAYAVIRGKWIVELAELDSFNKAESTGAKLFFGQYIDRYRNFYGKRASDVPRQQVFAGTTNSDAYLKDDTGNRRYWPVKVHRIDLEGLKEVRDQIWAEAVARYRAGEEWWPNSTERAMFEEEQDARYVGDEYIRLIRDWLLGRDSCTMADIMGEALKLDVAKWTRPEQQRIGRCMSEMGWKRVRSSKAVGGKRDWVYVRPESDPSTPAEGIHDDPI